MTRLKHLVVPFAMLVYFVTMCSNNATVASDQLPRSQILNGNKKHFVLVHGANHGAWCWYKLATLLTSTGHNVTALDLAASGINPLKLDQVHSFSDYVEPLMTFLGSLGTMERVILVGHSSGGAVVSSAMEKFPEKIVVAVYASAVMPGPSLGYSCQGINMSNGRLIPRWANFDREKRGHQLSSLEDLTLASALVKPTPAVSEEIKLTEEKYGSVRRVFLMSEQDLTIEMDIQLWMVRENPPNEVKLINCSDHMVMFSRPLELFCHLVQIAEKYSHEAHHHAT